MADCEGSEERTPVDRRRGVAGGRSGSVALRVSTNGGGDPKWRRDGRELFYPSPDGKLIRVAAILDMRRSTAESEWIFPAPARSGHIEKSSLKKQHARALKLGGVESFPPYTFRHTCLTRWAGYMDPYTLRYLAGHSDFA